MMKYLDEYIDIFFMAVRVYFTNTTLTWKEAKRYAERIVKGFK